MWRTLLIAMAILASPLAALDLEHSDANALVFARRALLRQNVRAKLGLKAGDFAGLDQAQLAKADFNGDGMRDVFVVLRRKATTAVVLYLGTRAGPGAERHAGAVFLADRGDEAIQTEVVKLGSRAYAVVSFTTTVKGKRQSQTTLTRVLIRHGKRAPKLVLAYARSRHLTVAKRYARRSAATLKPAKGGASAKGGAKGRFRLVETTHARLDGTPIPSSEWKRTTSFRQEKDGSLVELSVVSQPVPVALRTEIARRLERAGLAKLAAQHAREAEALAVRKGLKADDPRLLDARAMIERLAARKDAGALRPNPKLSIPDSK